MVFKSFSVYVMFESNLRYMQLSNLHFLSCFIYLSNKGQNTQKFLSFRNWGAFRGYRFESTIYSHI